MAYNGSETYEGLQNRHRKLKPEQNGWGTTAEVANKLAGMSLSPTTADSGQTSMHEAASAVEDDEQTSIKSSLIFSELNNAPPLSRELSFGCQGSMDLWPRQAVPDSGYFKNASSGELLSNPAKNGLPPQNPIHRDPSFSNSAPPREAEGQGHLNPLVMNIPPPQQEQKFKNTDIPTAIAEQQLSFRTVPTIGSDLPPISRFPEAQSGLYISQDIQNSKPVSVGTSPRGQLFNSSEAELHALKSEADDDKLGTDHDNFQLSWSQNPYMYNGMMAPNAYRQFPVWTNNLTGSGYNGRSAAGAGCGRQISHSSSSSSLRSFISENCLVKKLSWKILNHVALSLQCRNTSASWKDLVERYGWDYERTYLFENRPHQDGIFFSLLLEPEFQHYSLEQLREDLFELPRRDVLSDLNRMIVEHNASASGGPARQNQFP